MMIFDKPSFFYFFLTFLSLREEPWLRISQSLYLFRVLGPVHTLIAVSDIQEEILVMVLLVQSAHCGTCRGNHIVDKEEERILWSKVDTLADEEVELSDGEI